MPPAAIIGAAESPYRRHPERGVTTKRLLADAFLRALANAGIDRRHVDGLAVSSFTLGPDSAIELAWNLGVAVQWLAQSPLGGASGIDMLRQALRAVEAGDASVVVCVAGDRLLPEEFEALVYGYNRATRDELAPLPFGGPNTLFSFVTQRHAAEHGLSREDYAQIPLAQRAWAELNPGAAYRDAMTLDAYLAAPMVAPPLCRFDCVPIVSGANAIVVGDAALAPHRAIRVRGIRASYNTDQQEGPGTQTGLADVAERLWANATCTAADVDVAAIYDDYPVMTLVQLADLGFVRDGDLRSFLHGPIRNRELPVNTSGGQLSAGQAGAAGGMHGLVEVVTQLRGEAGERQIDDARIGLATGYGMVLYRYGACANAAVLEAP